MISVVIIALQPLENTFCSVISIRIPIVAWNVKSHSCFNYLLFVALAHLIFILSTKPEDWSGSEISQSHYELHAKIYTNVFFFLAVICFVSIMDRWVTRWQCVGRLLTVWNSFISHSIDICQFSMTSLLSSAEDKSRSISFRSIILIMIYAGTIILNLLAASVDNKFPMVKAQSAENSTIAETLENDNVVLVVHAMMWCLHPFHEYLISSFRTTRKWSICGIHYQSHEASVPL